MTEQCCGMDCLKEYEQYALLFLINLKENFTTYFLYDTSKTVTYNGSFVIL